MKILVSVEKESQQQVLVADSATPSTSNLTNDSFWNICILHAVHTTDLYDDGKGRCQESGPNEVPTVDGPPKPKVDTLPSTL